MEVYWLLVSDETYFSLPPTGFQHRFIIFMNCLRSFDGVSCGIITFIYGGSMSDEQLHIVVVFTEHEQTLTWMASTFKLILLRPGSRWNYRQCEFAVSWFPFPSIYRTICKLNDFLNEVLSIIKLPKEPSMTSNYKINLLYN